MQVEYTQAVTWNTRLLYIMTVICLFRVDKKKLTTLCVHLNFEQ